MRPIDGPGDQGVEPPGADVPQDGPDANQARGLNPGKRTVEGGDHGRNDAELAGPPDEWTTSFLEGTAKAFCQHLLVGLANAHGLGPVVTIAEYGYKVGQWLQVAADGRGLDAELPIPLVPGIELDLSARLEQGSADGKPAVSMCCAPSGDPPIGMLVIGGLNIGPGEEIGKAEGASRQGTSAPEPDAREDIAQVAAGAERRRVVVLRSELPEQAVLDHMPDVATVRPWAEEHLLLPIQTEQRTLNEADIIQVVISIPAVGVVVWLYLEDVGQSSWDATPKLPRQPARLPVSPSGSLKLWTRTNG